MYQSPNADIKLMMKQRHVRQWQIGFRMFPALLNKCKPLMPLITIDSR